MPKKIKINWWHAMDGGLGEGVTEIVRQFNESQDKYEMVETWKGRYRVVLNNTIAAYRAGEHPHIFQNNETGFLTLLLSGAIVPVHEILEKYGVEVDLDAYLSPVVATYTDGDKLLGMPFNSSTPIMYYNAALLKEAGFEEGPETWAGHGEHDQDRAGKRSSSARMATRSAATPIPAACGTMSRTGPRSTISPTPRFGMAVTVSVPS